MNRRIQPEVIDAEVDRDAAVEAAVAELDAGGVVALATDTVYGLAARQHDADAIERIYDLKRRPADRRMAILVDGVEQAVTLIEVTPVVRRLAGAFWPGPLTIVGRRSADTRVAARNGDGSGGEPRPDGEQDESIGVRCPDDDLVRSIAGRCGPLAVTSANLHGEPTPVGAAAVASLFPSVRVVLDGGDRAGAASTVVGVLDDRLEVLRSGPIGADDLLAALER